MRTALFPFIIFSAIMLNAQPSIRYTLSMPKPHNHLFEVTIRISDVTSPTLDLHMAAWRTGRYVIMDFAGGVQEFSAQNGSGKTLPFKKIDKDTWRIEKGKEKTALITYKVFANEFNMRTRELNGEHAFLDPLAVFMYVDELKNVPLQLTVVPYGDWKVTTGLEEVKGLPLTYSAPNFEYFGDCPIEIGRQQDFTFDVDGVPHIISMYGEGSWKIDSLISDIKKIVEVTKQFWGVLPYKKYVFLIHCQPNARGGTEHINSTVMGVQPFSFSDPAAYQNFLSLVSHEFFHTWNVKQLKPASIAPYDFSKENYSEEFWVSEGSTSYYDDLMLVRSKFIQPDRYLNIVTQMVNADRSRYGNTVQSLAESSFDAWIKYWRSRQNSNIAESNYYEKGSHVSLLLDLELRHRSKNKYSFDDVLRTMLKRFPPSKGFTNDDLKKVCEELGGGSFHEFFKNYIFGTAPLPWDQTLAYAGLELAPNESAPPVGLGITLSETNGRSVVTSILPGSPADLSGLELQDEIIALNGFKFRTSDLKPKLGLMKAGDTATLHLFRNEKIKEINVSLASVGAVSVTVRKMDNPDELQKSIYDRWLGISQ